MTVLIIDPFSSGSEYPRLLDESGIPFYILQTEESIKAQLAPNKNNEYLQYSDDFSNNPDHLYTWAIEKGINTVLTGAESGVPLAEALKEALKRNTAPNLLDKDFLSQRYNKHAMLQTAHDAGVDVGKFFKVSDPADLSNYTHYFAPDETVVIKPCISAGSVDVTLAKDHNQAERKIRELPTRHNIFGQENVPVLIQEFHRGTEFIVDIVSFNGKHQVVAVSNYDKHQNASGYFVYDRIKWISSEHTSYRTLVDYAYSILNALQYTDGSAHIEIMLTESGPFLIDIGFRPHGAGHPLRTYELTGNSQIHQEVSNALTREGTHEYVSGEYALHSFGSIEFFSLQQASQAKEALDFHDIQQLPQVRDFISNITPGEKYPETKTLLDSLSLGMCFIVADSPEEVRHIGEKVRELFNDSFITLP